MNAQKVNRYRSSENAFFKAYQLNPREHTISVEKLGINIRVQTVGRGQPLLFLHGAPTSGTTWVQLVASLPEYRCIIIDRPGCGLSEAIGYETLSREKLTDIIVAVIDTVLQHFQVEKLPMVASSFGGYLALLYMLQRPENITKLILEGCPAMVKGMKIPAFMKMMLAPGLKWLMPKLPTPPFLFSRFMKEMGHTYSINHEQVPEVFLEWHVSLFNHTDTLKNDIALISKTVPGGIMHPAFMLQDHEIEKITQPTLWLWGKEDAFGGIEVGQQLNAKMKNSSLIPFDNCGHLPWVDTPEANAAEIKAFVSK